MAVTRRRPGGLAIELAVTALAFTGLLLGLCGFHISRAETDTKTADMEARQVTVFGIIATPGIKTADATLASIKTQLSKLLPKHSFRLLDAQSKRIVAGESITCDLRNASRVVTTLVEPLDENGKVQIRCELFRDQELQFSTVVKTPPLQLFFCQSALPDGSQLLIGVGAREAALASMRTWPICRASIPRNFIGESTKSEDSPAGATKALTWSST